VSHGPISLYGIAESQSLFANECCKFFIDQVAKFGQLRFYSIKQEVAQSSKGTAAAAGRVSLDRGRDKGERGKGLVPSIIFETNLMGLCS
jgi:hypothetical protein